MGPASERQVVQHGRTDDACDDVAHTHKTTEFWMEYQSYIPKQYDPWASNEVQYIHKNGWTRNFTILLYAWNMEQNLIFLEPFL